MAINSLRYESAYATYMHDDRLDVGHSSSKSLLVDTPAIVSTEIYIPAYNPTDRPPCLGCQ